MPCAGPTATKYEFHMAVQSYYDGHMCHTSPLVLDPFDLITKSDAEPEKWTRERLTYHNHTGSIASHMPLIEDQVYGQSRALGETQFQVRACSQYFRQQQREMASRLAPHHIFGTTHVSSCYLVCLSIVLCYLVLSSAEGGIRDLSVVWGQIVLSFASQFARRAIKCRL